VEKWGNRLPSAIIFDLDGVLCSTDHYHYLAWKTIADKLGIPFDEKINDRLRGVSRMESLEIILQNYKGEMSQVEKEELAAEKNEVYRAYLVNMTPLDVSQEVRNTLSGLKELGVPIAVGSSSKNAGLILKQTELAPLFDVISDGNNITKSKPDPEVFLKAAEYLNIPPEKCWVVEDAQSGIEATRRAGMLAVAYGSAAQEKLGDLNLTQFSQLFQWMEKIFTEVGEAV
jgi:beta-phosphoglucomutase